MPSRNETRRWAVTRQSRPRKSLRVASDDTPKTLDRRTKHQPTVNVTSPCTRDRCSVNIHATTRTIGQLRNIINSAYGQYPSTGPHSGIMSWFSGRAMPLGTASLFAVLSLCSPKSLGATSQRASCGVGRTPCLRLLRALSLCACYAFKSHSLCTR